MKKLTLLFAGLSLFIATGCKNDNDTVVETPAIIGVWQPIKEVITTIETGEQPVSDLITYSDCQKQSRWRFDTETMGKRTNWGDTVTPGQCAIESEQNFTYIYDKGGKTMQIKYQGTAQASNTQVTTLNETTLNLAIREDTTDPNIYKTRTYTFKRVTQ